MPAARHHESPELGQSPPPSVWLPPPGHDVSQASAQQSAWWLTARLVAQFSRSGGAVVHVDGSGCSTMLSAAQSSGDLGYVGLVVVELPDGTESDERLPAACRSLSTAGVLAVILPTDPTDDLAGHTVAAVRAAGLVYLQHIVALDHPVPEDIIDAPARSRPVAPAAHARVHRDILIFTQPDLTAPGEQR